MSSLLYVLLALLMLGVLRTAPAGHQAVLDGEQISRKEKLMLEGITDLADCTVGLVGFGDIAKETALRLKAFGCRCLYYSRNRKSREVEETCGVTYAELPELLAGCDIVMAAVSIANAQPCNLGTPAIGAHLAKRYETYRLDEYLSAGTA